MTIWKPLLLLTSIGLLAACASAPKNPNPRADQPVKLAKIDDLSRYMGRWYVIAEIPWFGEKGYVGNQSLWAIMSLYQVPGLITPGHLTSSGTRWPPS